MDSDLKSVIDLIKYPILTEKTIRLFEQNNYSFAVDSKVIKNLFKVAVEQLFSVKVL
jgi:large subunit ribosomal protein L23